MESYAGQRMAVSTIAPGRSHDWVHQVINLLDAALHQLYRKEETARGTILNAASVLRQQLDPPAPQEAPDGGRLLAWQVRKVLDYIDSHITGPVLVADLGALIQCSAGHFSRCFKRTFGKPPHSFVIRRRVELAAQYMLSTDASLSDVALRCGFADQAHLCKHFRQTAGHTPAAWRRAQKSHHQEAGTAAGSEDESDTARSAPRLPLRYGFSTKVQDSAARPSDAMMAAANEAHPEGAAKPTRRSITSMW